MILRSLAALVCGGVMIGSGIAVAQQNGDSSGVEVLTRGPVHEAFAATVSYNPEPGILVKNQPPTAIEEVPPEQRPEGENVAWIPGYWAWDEEQSDFLWISGIWRNLPPGRQWVPGYWVAIDGQYQWTSGYWEDAATTEVSYLPEPPRSVEVGPNIEAPSNNHSWIPGNWRWRDERYAWQTGYWAPVRQNWVWTPAYYRWTRRGYVCVDGYWDYAVPRRGIVFAPVHFRRPVYLEPDYYYSPVTVISINVFVNHLFVRPRYCHYYFGDYYEPRYRDRGFFASYSYNSSRRGYDPIYSHYRWENRDDRNWENRRREDFEYRRDHEDARPPRTWAALSSRPEADRGRGGTFDVAEPLDRFVSKKDGGDRPRFQAVDKQERERLVSQRQEIRKFGREREQLETRAELPTEAGEKNRRESRVKIDRSPVVARESDRSDKDGGPPARLQPRASERDQRKEKAGSPGTDPQPGEDPSKQRRNKDGTANRDGNPLSTDRVEPAPERRVKPGQKREAEPKPERGVRPGEKREAEPKSDRKIDPVATPETGKAAKSQDAPRPDRQSELQPARKAQSEPKKRQSDTPPADNAERAATRQEAPRPDVKKAEKSQEVVPRQSRQEAPPTSKKADPRRADEPQPQKAQRQPQPQQEQRAQPQKAQRQPQPQQEQRAQPQQAAPKQGRSRPAATDEEDPRKKKGQTE